MEAQLPSKWKWLTIRLYDGSTDPNEHLNVFKTQMNLYTTNKVVWCKVFPTSLREGALSWFTRLPPNLVDCFKAFAAKVTTQYATIRPHHMSLMTLFNVKQEKWESLRTFMERFSKVCMGIKYLMPKIAMHHLVSAIRLGRFTESLIKRPAKDLDELRNWATMFMQIEESSDFRRIVRSENGGDKGKEKDRVNRPTSGRSNRFRENWGPRFLNYTYWMLQGVKILTSHYRPS